MLFFKHKTKHKEKPAPRALSFKSNEIRKIMNKTGWDAYESYCAMLNMNIIFNGPSPSEMVKQNLWKDYKILQAESLVRNGRYLEPKAKPDFTREEFYDLFYTAKQKAVIKSIKTGKITFGQLIDFLEIKMPEELLSRKDEDIAGRIATYINNNHYIPDGVLLCASRKYVKEEFVKGRSLMCIIGFGSYKEDFGDISFPYIPCSNIKSYLIDLSELWRSRSGAKSVGISGSIGKTTTTEMMSLVAHSSRTTFRKTGNRNTTWQIAQFAYEVLPEHEVYVQEASGSYLSQLETSSRIIRPNVFILTNIGQGHIGKYDGRQELLLYEKLALDRHAADDGVGVINWDDKLLKTLKYNHKIVTYAVEDRNADYFSDNIVEKDGYITFDIVEKGYGRTKAILNVIGRHNIYNALSAFAAGVLLGIDRDTIVNALAKFKTEGLRQNLTTLGGRRLYLDCYSATIESMEIGMRSLGTISVPEGAKKIAVLGDIPALEDSENGHRIVGKMTAEVDTADEVIFYGEEMAYAYEEAKALSVNCRHMTDRIELEHYLLEETTPDDLVMFKASHKVAFQWVIDDLFGTNNYAHDELTLFDPVSICGDYRYKSIEEYGVCIEKFIGDLTEVDVPASYEGLPVRLIDNGAFAGSPVEKVVIHEPLTGITENAFANCVSLISISIPDTLMYIGKQAFNGCSSLKKIDLSDTVCSTIEAKAFAGCRSLEIIKLPASLKTIRDDAFDNNTQAGFVCPKGSYAETWVNNQGFKLL